MIDQTPPPKSLRRTVLAVMVPLVALVVTGVCVGIWMARTVHADLIRLFGELRATELSQAIVDELKGVAAWVKSLPAATHKSHPHVCADVRQHFLVAQETMDLFWHITDNIVTTDGDMQRMTRELSSNMASLRDALDQRQALANCRSHLDSALYHAQAIANAVGDESREIGNDMDEHTGEMIRMLAVLGLASLTAVAALGILLLRRVLRPVSELRDSAVRLGRGEDHVQLPIRRNDELGELAQAFDNMAQQIRVDHQDLEDRIEQRSLEVLRTAKLAQLGTLAAGIAHEINNPLASIVACSDGVLRDIKNGTPDTSNLQDYLQIVRKEAMRTRDITSKLLRFARDDGQTREVMSLHAQIREVAALFHHQMATAGVALTLDDHSGEGAISADIVGDPSEWRQVLFNLVGNALDASPPGSQIIVQTGGTTQEVELRVCDQGAGIAEDAIDRVFEPFFTTKGPGQGTGLGLTIVHRIVLAHGGRIRICNDYPGTTVTITVPRAGV